MRSDWRRPDNWDLPGEGEVRIKLDVAYDGSCFHGWQAQDNAASVQAVMSDALSTVLGVKTTVCASGRTDAGVHALHQGCHFDTSSKIAPEKFSVILNTKLPKSVRVLKSEKAPDGFHARFSTMSREYWYLVKKESEMLPFDNLHIMAVRRDLDLEILDQYASVLMGTHDFTTFASARDLSESRFRDVYISIWDSFLDVFGFTIYRYRVAGNAFLYHQVRSMAGTMLTSFALGESVEDFKARLDAKDRSKALRTAPAEGLYLADVSYDAAKYQWFEELYAR